MDEYTRNKMPAEAGRRIEERRQEFNAAWDKEEARQKLLAEEKRTLECVNAMLGIPDPAATMTEVREVLEALEDYFDNRADADQAPGDTPTPNEEMRHQVTIRALLAKLEGK